MEKAREQEEREALEEQARKNLEAQERSIREFELTQAGLAVKGGVPAAKGKAEVATKPPPDEQRGEKRKREDAQFQLEQGELERISEERLSKARKEMEDEKVGALTEVSYNSASNSSVAGIKTNSAVLLVALSDTIIQQEGHPPRSQEEGKKSTNMSSISRRPAASVLPSHAHRRQLHRRDRRQHKSQAKDMSCM